MPRMTNTYMLAGQSDVPEEIVSPVLIRVFMSANMGGGQVDITSGKFVFSTSEAYLITKNTTQFLLLKNDVLWFY